MRLPVCELCAQTKSLCSGCENNLRTGRITEADVSTSNVLAELSDKFNLKGAGFTRAVDLGRAVLIFTNGDVGVLIGRRGRIVSEISHRLGKKVRIAKQSGDVRKMISDVLMPVRLLGLNTVYSGGERSYRVRLQRRDIRKLPVDVRTLEKALGSILRSPAAVSFE